jgi:hypothetical protein
VIMEKTVSMELAQAALEVFAKVHGIVMVGKTASMESAPVVLEAPAKVHGTVMVARTVLTVLARVS